jgi:hypothetical protein
MSYLDIGIQCGHVVCTIRYLDIMEGSRVSLHGVHVLELIGHHGGVQGLTLMHRDQLGHYGRVQAWREVRGVGLGQHG